MNPGVKESMLEHDDSQDDLTAVLSWLHPRLDNSFTIDMGRLVDHGTVLRGREPSDRSPEDDSESYAIDVFTRVATIPIDRQRLREVEILDDGQTLRLTFHGGARVEIVDER